MFHQELVEYDPQDFFTPVADKASTYFWLGFILNTGGYTLMIINNSPNKIFTLLQFLGILIMIPSAFWLVKFKIENKYLATLFIAYFFWVLVIISRGIKLDKDSIIKLLLDAYGGLFMYLSPLILLFPRNMIYIKKALNVATVLGILYLLFSVFFIGELLATESENGQRILEYFAKQLALPTGLVLLLSAYYSNRRMLVTLVVIIFTFLLAAIRARRGLMFMSTNIIVFSFLFYFFASKGNLIKRFLPLVLLPFVIFYAVHTYQKNKQGTFNYISERFDEDTRSDVVKFFVLDMERQDWLIGRGINGDYYYPGFDGSNSNYRSVIETDYLQIILKGGLINLLILLLITIPAMVKGVFYSKNMLARASGLWILFWIVNLYPTSVTNFTLNYLIVWIAVGICYSKEIREIPDEQIKEFMQTSRIRYFI